MGYLFLQGGIFDLQTVHFMHGQRQCVRGTVYTYIHVGHIVSARPEVLLPRWQAKSRTESRKYVNKPVRPLRSGQVRWLTLKIANFICEPFGLGASEVLCFVGVRPYDPYGLHILFMYVCMYIYIYTHIHTQIYRWIYMHICMFIFLYIDIDMILQVALWKHVQVPVKRATGRSTLWHWKASINFFCLLGGKQIYPYSWREIEYSQGK